MESWIILVVFSLLLAGAFLFKKLWLGAILAIIFYVSSHVIFENSFEFVFIPFLSGSIISFELILLLFGAYLFYTILYSNNHFNQFIEVTGSFSSKLFSLIILCIFLGSFMEGIAGFGIPAMLIAPLLITLGFKPLTSIVLPLSTNTVAVTFGALGTPLKIGLGIYAYEPTVFYILILNCIPALVLPFIMAYLYGKTEQTLVNWKKDWKMLLGAGICFTIPYVLAGLFSIEYPSVIAGIIGLLVFVLLFLPKAEKPKLVFWFNTFYPYLIFVLLLIIFKYILSGKSLLIDENARPLAYYQPGFIFILASCLYVLIKQPKSILSSLYIQGKETVLKTAKSISTIFLLVFLAQLIRNDLAMIVEAHYLSMPVIAKLLVNPLIGITGSFISGSATMSNILFANAIQADTLAAGALPLLLALLHTGSSIGNAISLQNIIMVKSVVNQPLIGYFQIFKYNFIVVIVYVILILVIGAILL